MLDIHDSLYEPFIRRDQYGHLGLAPQPAWEYARLAVLAVTVVPLKFIGAIACLFSFYTVCRISVLLPRHIRDQVVPATGKFACRALLLCIGFTHIRWIKVAAELPHAGAPKAQGDTLDGPAVGIVSNHVGWSDILIQMSRYFPSFVARSATKDLLMVGLISQNMGCIYVDRETKTKTEGVAGAVKDRMVKAARGAAAGERPMLLFPEGTTTNGDFLLPFKTGAFLAGAPVQPVIIRYDKDRVSPAWETISAARQLFLLLCNPFHGVTCYELPVYHPSPAEAEDPKLYAANVREFMLSQSFGLKSSTSSWKDKMVLHAFLKGEDSPVSKLRRQEDPVTKKQS